MSIGLHSLLSLSIFYLYGLFL